MSILKSSKVLIGNTCFFFVDTSIVSGNFSLLSCWLELPHIVVRSMVATHHLVCFYSSALDVKLLKGLNTDFKVGTVSMCLGLAWSTTTKENRKHSPGRLQLYAHNSVWQFRKIWNQELIREVFVCTCRKITS